jgi:hypothetical protein
MPDDRLKLKIEKNNKPNVSTVVPLSGPFPLSK